MAVTRLTRLVYGFSLTKILVSSQCMWDFVVRESVTASALLHIRVIRKMDSGHITYRTGMRHVV